jgi:hypothetical protein
MMNPPAMAGWNLALRFVLELAALVGLGAAAWSSNSGAMRWVLVIAVPLAAATVWGVFNVLNDPSRSGQAPIVVAGWVRVVIELFVLGGGAIAIGIAWSPILGIVFAVLVAVHYLASLNRVRWLLRQ